MLIVFACTSSEHNNVASANRIPGSYLAMEQFSKIQAYPDGVPTSGYMDAYREHSKALKTQVNSREANWTAMGPLNTAGRCLTIGINPQDANTIYVGSASGGLWRSRDLGLNLTWERIETGFPVLGVSTIAFADQDSTVMLIGTGEVYNVEVTGNDGAYRATRGSYGIGILKSLDGGQTWSHSLDWSYSQNEGVWMIKIAKTDPNIVYAGTTQGVLKSTDQGETWENVFENPLVTDVEIDPTDPEKIVIACGNFDTPGKGIYTSDDGGNTWVQSTGVPASFNGKILLAQSSSDPNIVYASVGNGFSGADGFTWLLRSEDGGQNFELRNETDYSRWQGWFSHDVSIHPTNPNEVITVGINIFKSTDAGDYLREISNGGVTLGDVDILGPDGPPNFSHSDHHFVLHHPEVEDLVLFGNDGGVYLSFDGGETFRSANAGLQTTQFYNGFSVSDTETNIALGGLQDNSTSQFSGSQAWSREIGGDGSWTAINQLNNDIIYGSSQNLRIAKSVNRGDNWFTRSPNLTNDNPLFIAPYVISKTNPDRMYAGARFFYRSDDGAESWIRMNNETQLNGDPIFALDVSDIDEDVVYAGTAPEDNPAALFNTRDGGLSFTEVSPVTNRIVNDVTVFPGQPESAIAVYSGFGTPHVFRTNDFGSSWTDISNNLPDVPTNAVIVNPFDLDEIYIGNDLGVYISKNGGDSWEPYQTGLPTAFIAIDLKISLADNTLWVATHGNGIYQTPLESFPSSNENEALENLVIYPNPTQDFFTIEGISANNLITVYDVNGKRVIQQTNKSNIQIGNLPSGTYIVNIKDNNKQINISKRLIKQ